MSECDHDSSETTCKKCGDEYTLRFGCEPTDYCDECAQEMVIELQQELGQAQASLKFAQRSQEGIAEQLAAAQKAVDHVDLMRDEFKRICACCAGGASWAEIRALCDRAIMSIEQNVPVVVQRDKAEGELAALRREVVEVLGPFAVIVDESKDDAAELFRFRGQVAALTYGDCRRAQALADKCREFNQTSQ